jgi:2-keto-3-deoxy-L-rhamnonate aldolase RhmA
VLGLARQQLSTEILRYAGFDWLLIDSEHAPNEMKQGMTFVAVGGDVGLLRTARKRLADKVIR